MYNNDKNYVQFSSSLFGVLCLFCVPIEESTAKVAHSIH